LVSILKAQSAQTSTSDLFNLKHKIECCGYERLSYVGVFPAKVVAEILGLSIIVIKCVRGFVNSFNLR
jgi:hypothetical protein